MSGKTPVMILQEFMTQNRQTPEYELIHNGVGTHEPFFQYAVRAQSVIATGSGRSKKEAKHEAAKNCLKKLEDEGLFISDESPTTSSVIDSPKKTTVLSVNYVGALKDLCIERSVANPNFDLLLDGGPSHAREFTIQCSVGNIKQRAIASTKKSAKQLAAKKMVECLIDTLDSGGIIVPFEDDIQKIDKKANEFYNEIRNEAYLSQKIITRTIPGHNKLENELKSKCLSILENKDTFCKIDLLKELLNVMKIEFISETMPTNNNLVQITSITIFHGTSLVFMGAGDQKKEAEENAANEAIEYFEIMFF